MARVFHPRTNTIAKAGVFGVFLAIGAVIWIATEIEGSSWASDEGVVRDQPVPFSHEHHVRGLGLDCRYCHTSVTDSSFAGLPATKICMACHSKIWTNAPVLEPVRESWRTGTAIAWQRVHNLPDYVYFNHQIHVEKGVGCTTCHGQVDQMPLMMQAAPLQMGWCLSCHREPERYLRPRERVFDAEYAPPANQLERGHKLAEQYELRTPQLMQNCSLCHR
jgi:hypothetical protein